MSVILHPDISSLNPEGLCYSIYIQLYNNFFNAQDKKDEYHPWGVVEGDETSIRLRNTAFNFAEAIAGAVNGGEGNIEGGVLLNYLKKSGGNMSGTLTANYGFQAGIENNRIIEAFCDEQEDEQGISNRYGLLVTGDLEIGSNNLYIGGKQFISYDRPTDTVRFSNPKISFSTSSIFAQGDMLFGNSKEAGVYISPNLLLIKGNEVYHKGNAGNENVSWEMLDGTVNGELLVKGKSTLKGVLRACYGIELGFGSTVYLSTGEGKINSNTGINFTSDFGIYFQGKPVLKGNSNKDIQLGAYGGDLLLGNDNTSKIKLLSNIADIDGDYILLSKYGAAYFPDSLTVRHNYGELLLSSYRTDSIDEGITIHKKLRFSTNGAYLSGKDNGIVFSSKLLRINSETDEKQTFSYETELKYDASTSFYQPLDRFSNSLFISSDADFVVFNKPVESTEYIGIDKSATRLANGRLFFSNENYLLSSTDGIKHNGNAYFLGGISSEKFSSGFAGSGWSILLNKTTGNVAATFDELTIRKKMRIYELEVQKLSATNGSLWISDNCSGDTVIKL